MFFLFFHHISIYLKSSTCCWLLDRVRVRVRVTGLSFFVVRLISPSSSQEGRKVELVNFNHLKSGVMRLYNIRKRFQNTLYNVIHKRTINTTANKNKTEMGFFINRDVLFQHHQHHLQRESEIHVKAISFDLDETLWECWPVLDRAAKEYHRYLMDNHPKLAEHYPRHEFYKICEVVREEFPCISHCHSKVRFEALKKCLKTLNYTPTAIDEIASHLLDTFVTFRSNVDGYFFEGTLESLEKIKSEYPQAVLLSLTDGNADVARVQKLNGVFDLSLTAGCCGASKSSGIPFKIVKKKVKELERSRRTKSDRSGAKSDSSGAKSDRSGAKSGRSGAKSDRSGAKSDSKNHMNNNYMNNKDDSTILSKNHEVFIHVGDSVRSDILPARNHGYLTILTKTGTNRSGTSVALKEGESGALIECDSIADVPDALSALLKIF